MQNKFNCKSVMPTASTINYFLIIIIIIIIIIPEKQFSFTELHLQSRQIALLHVVLAFLYYRDVTQQTQD
jgi:hypothetical protein